MLRTIETTGVVTPEHTITLKLPDDFPEGECRVVVVASEAKPSLRKLNWADLPPLDAELLNPNDTPARGHVWGRRSLSRYSWIRMSSSSPGFRVPRFTRSLKMR